MQFGMAIYGLELNIILFNVFIDVCIVALVSRIAPK